MPRLSIRLTDATLAALRRELDSERAFRGRRYSLNDLCVRKLGGSVAPSWQHGDVTERVPQLRTPPPPPVPKTLLTTSNWLRDYVVPAEEPQPERVARPQPAGESESGTPCATEPLSLVTSQGPAADGADPEANESAIAAMESEGGPDGASEPTT